LKNAGVDQRQAHCYAGHEQPGGTVQDRFYDLGPSCTQLHAIADLLDTMVSDELGTPDLSSRTPLPESGAIRSPYVPKLPVKRVVGASYQEPGAS
jgi:hypothetical protein